MSKPSVTPVATGTTSVFLNTPVLRFQQAIQVELQVSDLERRVQRLARSLTPLAFESSRGARRRHQTVSDWPTA